MASSIDAVNNEASLEGCIYMPGGDFKEIQDVPCVEISSTDSTEVWLIQEPMNQLVREDFHGKGISLKIDGDKLGKVTSSNGKLYELVAFTSQETDAVAFLGGDADSNKVVKISRHACLVRYPDASDLEKSKTSTGLSSQKTGVSQRTGMQSHSMAPSTPIGESSRARTSHDTLTSTHSMGGHSVESTKYTSNKRSRNSSSSVQTGRSTGSLSQPESQVTGSSFGVPNESPGHNSSKKKKKSKQ